MSEHNEIINRKIAYMKGLEDALVEAAGIWEGEVEVMAGGLAGPYSERAAELHQATFNLRGAVLRCHSVLLREEKLFWAATANDAHTSEGAGG